MGLLGRWLPVVAWAALIATLSTGSFSGERTGHWFLPLLGRLLPGASEDALRLVHEALRKLAHFGEYLVLSLLLGRALAAGRGWSARIAVWAVVLAGLYAVSDEMHQWFVPARGASPLDCLIDVAGAIAGQALVAARQRSVPISAGSVRRAPP